MQTTDRRGFLKLLTVGGAVFASGLQGACARAARAGGSAEDFFFVQLSDTHWGFQGPPNPEAASTLPQAIEAVNGLPALPDFVVFTGDLTHTTDDPAERRARLAQFRQHVSRLRAPRLLFLPGEHDASLDAGAAFQEQFGPTRWSFDHKGIRFVALDNVSDPEGALGSAQVDWLAAQLEGLRPDAPVVVLTHRPLFALYPQWDWATKDGAKAIDVLQHHRNVTVLYGHIHQEHHHVTAGVQHHAARSLIFPLPPPGSQPKRSPLPWDPAHPGRGLGWREVSEEAAGGAPRLLEVDLPLAAPRAQAAPRRVPIVARRFQFTPDRVELERGVPVVLALSTLDRTHGFAAPALGLEARIEPGPPLEVPLTPDRAGTFAFYCDIFCGSGHEGMSGTLVVREPAAP